MTQSIKVIAVSRRPKLEVVKECFTKCLIHQSFDRASHFLNALMLDLEQKVLNAPVEAIILPKIRAN